MKTIIYRKILQSNFSVFIPLTSLENNKIVLFVSQSNFYQLLLLLFGKMCYKLVCSDLPMKWDWVL